MKIPIKVRLKLLGKLMEKNMQEKSRPQCANEDQLREYMQANSRTYNPDMRK